MSATLTVVLATNYDANGAAVPMSLEDLSDFIAIAQMIGMPTSARLKIGVAEVSVSCGMDAFVDEDLDDEPTAPSSNGKSSTDAKQIRLWAKENNVTCPAKGMVPKQVRAAYEEAHGGTS